MGVARVHHRLHKPFGDGRGLDYVYQAVNNDKAVTFE